MLIRLVDHLKMQNITALFTSLTSGGEALEKTETAISSIVDTWLLLKTIELSGERNRGLYVLKSRGMAHSNQIREFLLTPQGVQLLDVYVGEGGVLTGSARLAQEARERQEEEVRLAEVERARRLLERRRALYNEQLARLRADFEAEMLELEHKISESVHDESLRVDDKNAMARMRRAD
jgi:circadian clock protein KaiC